MSEATGGTAAFGLLKRERLMLAADGLAVAVVVSLPWSTSAATISNSYLRRWAICMRRQSLQVRHILVCEGSLENFMKKLNVDFDEIQKAMEDTARDAFDYFLDGETGEVIILSEDIISRARLLLDEPLDEDMDDFEDVEFDELQEIPEWMEDEIELALDIFLHDKERNTRIPERLHRLGYNAMREFASTLEGNPLLKEALLGILEGQGAFRRFKDELAPYPKERKQWYVFNATTPEKR